MEREWESQRDSQSRRRSHGDSVQLTQLIPRLQDSARLCPGCVVQSACRKVAGPVTEDNPVAAPPRPAPRPPADDSQLYDQIDTDGSGELSLEEVVAAIGMLCTFCSVEISCWFPHVRSPC